MLDRDRATRLGSANDAEDVLRHPFFAGLDLKKLVKRTLPAPFVPVIPDLENLRALGGQLTFKDF